MKKYIKILHNFITYIIFYINTIKRNRKIIDRNNNDIIIVNATIEKISWDTIAGTVVPPYNSVITESIIKSVSYKDIFNSVPHIILSNFIRPDRYNLLTVIRLTRMINKIEKKNLEKYISFTRFNDGYDKIYCDWCSICNGLLEYSLDIIFSNINNKKINNIGELKSIDNNLILLKNIYYCYNTSPEKLLKKSKYKNVISEKINKNIFVKKKEAVIKNINDVVILKEALELVEQTFCPFLHLKKINFKRDYYYYNPNNSKDLEIAKKILIKNKKITCHNCVKIINKELEEKKNDYKFFGDYLKYLINI